jgi:hypothetical protein
LLWKKAAAAEKTACQGCGSHYLNRPSRFFTDFQVCRKAGNWYKGIKKPGAAAGLFPGACSYFY